MEIDVFVCKCVVRKCRDNQFVKGTLWMLIKDSKCVCMGFGEGAEYPYEERGSEWV